jgi:hypothetical protein
MNPATSRFVCVSILASALPHPAGPAFAQQCHRYWTRAADGIGVSSGSTPISLAALPGPSGTTLFMSNQMLQAQVFRRDGAQWTDISSNLPALTSRGGRLIALDEGNGPELYYHGNMQGPGSVFFARRWNGQQWDALDSAFVREDGSTRPIDSCDDGTGSRIYGLVRNNKSGGQAVARWEGDHWELMGPYFQHLNLRIVAADFGQGRSIYIVGEFNDIGGVTTNGLARWNGTAWERPPHNASAISAPRDIALFDDGAGLKLYVYTYVYVNGQELPGIARWDGATWEGLGGPAGGPGVVFGRSRVAVFDDGSGPALYVTGSFSTWGGIPARSIAKWNGKAWSAVGSGFSGGDNVNSMAVHHDVRGPSLFIGGSTNLVSGAPNDRIRQWVGCPSCYANCDLSTIGPTLNVRDFACFLNKFADLDPYANCDQSTANPALDVADFLCFLNKFAAGCP